jgi:hypothetical protein
MCSRIIAPPSPTTEEVISSTIYLQRKLTIKLFLNVTSNSPLLPCDVASFILSACTAFMIRVLCPRICKYTITGISPRSFVQVAYLQEKVKLTECKTEKKGEPN